MMKKLLITALLFSAGTILAQEFDWQWAKSGGGSRRAYTEFIADFSPNSEHIKDIAIDEDNNYYFLTQVSTNNTNYDGVPFDVYNYSESADGYADILLLSTTCDGTYRWSRVIGGGNFDQGYNIALDDNGGVYVSAYVFNDANQGSITFEPPHFSEDDHLPALPPNVNVLDNHPGHKKLAIAKYTQETGSLVWRKMLQGDVNIFTSIGTISPIHVEGDGTIRVLVGLLKGTHLDGLAVVPETYDFIVGQGANYFKYFIVKMDANGNYEDVMPLNFEGVVNSTMMKFRYDPVAHHYYIGGHRTTEAYYPGENSWMENFSYGGTTFNKAMVLLALSEDGQELWRKEFTTTPDVLGSDFLRDIQLDDESNIYICGRYFRLAGDNYPNLAYSWGGYTIPDMTGMGNRKYIMKMDSNGEVLWYQSNSGFTTPAAPTGLTEGICIGIGENEILLGGDGNNESWNGFELNRPNAHRNDPIVVKFDKQTGVVTGMHQIMGPPGYNDSVTAIKMDNDGNYVVGGFVRYQLFTDENEGIPTITSSSVMDGFTDFFVAKLGATECGVPVAGVKSFDEGHLKVYPNPVYNSITIESVLALESYEVINLMGQVLMKGSLDGQATISLGALANGTYIVNVTDKKGNSISKKIVKQ